MTIESIIRNRKGIAGSNGSWQVKVQFDGSVGLWHYQTLMLKWYPFDTGPIALSMSIGNGSVSDQGGMNTAFKVLGLPYYYSRKGGVAIIERTGER